MLQLLQQPWAWYFSGAMIALVMLLLLWSGGQFGVSSSLRTLCTLGGAGKNCSFFCFDWKSELWNLVFILGILIGGGIASIFLTPEGYAPSIAADTVTELSQLGFGAVSGMLPQELFGTDALFSLKGLSLLGIGGFFVGFGARYAGGCTSGHAISGLSNFQLPSLIAVIGFFLGGLLMTFGIMPLLFG